MMECSREQRGSSTLERRVEGVEGSEGRLDLGEGCARVVTVASIGAGAGARAGVGVGAGAGVVGLLAVWVWAWGSEGLQV